jgi:mannose-6-phosphate isomerase-like protein (cupin superfamily)
MTPPTPVDPIVERSDEGRALQFSPSERLVWKATAQTTGGVLDHFELTADPGHAGAPEHVHHAVDELFYVLEGAFRFTVRDELLVAPAGTFPPAGTFLFVPRETRHTWTNAAQTRSRMSLTYVPGGMQPVFEEASPYMDADEVDMAGLERVNERYRTAVVGPPLAPGR